MGYGVCFLDVVFELVGDFNKYLVVGFVFFGVIECFEIIEIEKE